MFYILHGDEEFTRSEQVSELKGRVARDGLGDLNISILDGRRIELRELMDACNAIPFLGDRRLVIVEGLLQRFDPKGGSRRRRRPARAKRPRKPTDVDAEEAFAGALASYLPHLPPTTRLLFVEPKSLHARNPILALASDSDDGYVRAFDRPDARRLQDWIRQRARAKGVSIVPQAVFLLASFSGHDLRLLDQELEKLAALANYEREVTDKDVAALVSTTHDSDIFAMVDALGLRQRKAALRQLHLLLSSGASDLYLLSMIVRQIRLILGAKDLVEQEGAPPVEVGKRLGISHRFIVDKLLRQAQHFQADELVAILRRTLEVDEGIKTGRYDGALALELLVVEVCSAPPGATTGSQNVRSRVRSR